MRPGNKWVDRNLCIMCHRYITDRGWGAVCCEVCWDSMDAEFGREIESGYIDSLFRRNDQEETQ